MYKARHGLDLARKKRHGTVFLARNGFETRHGTVRPGTVFWARFFYEARHGTVFWARNGLARMRILNSNLK